MPAEKKDKLKSEIDRLKKKLKKQEKEINKLKVSNLFLGTLFDGISEEIMVVDKDFMIRDVNKTFLKKYGLKKNDALGNKCYEVKRRVNTPCDFERDFCPIPRAQKSGEMVEMSHSHRNLAGDDSEHILMMYPLKSKGEMIDCFVEISRDVTEYRKLIRKVKASEKRFRAILDSATDAIISIDENHNIILFNNAAERIFGYTRQEILGQNLNMLIPPRYGDHSRYVKRFLEKKESDIIGKTISSRALRKGGEEFPVEFGLSYLEMDGSMTFTAIIRDISEQQRLEKKVLQSERLAAVGHSATHVVHELKNPLMIIGGFSSQIMRNLTDERDINKMDMILEEVYRLERLVAELGDFTREYNLIKRKADINTVIRDVMRIMTGIYPADIYEFRESLSNEMDEISCDPDKLKQVFINLISNGFEAMREGGTITITTASTSNGVEIKISDEGVGIPEKDLQHVFEPFYTTRERGSGLGLPISYKIIEAHKGDITALSRPGEGTTFIIKLPAH